MRGRPKLFKKLTGHELLHSSKETGFEFYAKLNEFMDISLIMFNTDSKTIREFIIDSAIFSAIHQFYKDGKFTPIPAFVNAKGAKPNPVRTLVEKEGYTIIKTGNSKVIKSFTLAKVSKFFIDELEFSTLEVKRFVFKNGEGSPMIGMDSISIPEFVAPEFISYLKKVFKREDLEIEFEGEENAND
jgi:hypothetical protein